MRHARVTIVVVVFGLVVIMYYLRRTSYIECEPHRHLVLPNCNNKDEMPH